MCTTKLSSKISFIKNLAYTVLAHPRDRKLSFINSIAISDSNIFSTCHSIKSEGYAPFKSQMELICIYSSINASVLPVYIFWDSMKLLLKLHVIVYFIFTCHLWAETDRYQVSDRFFNGSLLRKTKMEACSVSDFTV